MSFIQRELDRLGDALRADPKADDYPALYAAQQALAWALEPHGFASPMKMLRGGPVDSSDPAGLPSSPLPREDADDERSAP